MEKRYQVFISSTFTDLQEERWQALRGLMSIDCIVSGMEMFPAIDQDQFEYIKEVISSCDYYLLIIGGRYGSVSDDELSYTEKEYDFAVSKNIKVIALLHRDPEKLPVEKKDDDPTLFDKLMKFRDKVTTGRMVDFWNDSSEIQGKVLIGLTQAIKHFPAIGWVKGNVAAKEELLTEINEVRKKNSQLEKELSELKKQLQPDLTNLASLDDTIELNFRLRRYNKKYGESYISKTQQITWRNLFYLISPSLMQTIHIDKIQSKVDSCLTTYWKKDDSISDTYGRELSVRLEQSDFETIILQYRALGLISCDELPLVKGGSGLFCKLKPLGHKVMMEIRTKKGNQENEASSDPRPPLVALAAFPTPAPK